MTVYFLFLQKTIELCNQRDESQDWHSKSKSVNYIRSAILHYFGSIQITFFNHPRTFMVTFQCQLDRAMNANSAEPVTSCPLLQTWLNEPELDNPCSTLSAIHERQVHFLSKRSTNYMTMPQVFNFRSETLFSNTIRRTFAEHSPNIHRASLRQSRRRIRLVDSPVRKTYGR